MKFEFSAIEGWEYVKRALRNSIYDSQLCFDSMPEFVQKIVGSPRQLREWAMMPITDVNSFVRRGFIDKFEKLQD